MSAKTDFDLAWHLVIEARALALPHLDPHIYPLEVEAFHFLVARLGQLRIAGGTKPQTKPP